MFVLLVLGLIGLNVFQTYQNSKIYTNYECGYDCSVNQCSLYVNPYKSSGKLNDLFISKPSFSMQSFKYNFSECKHVKYFCKDKISEIKLKQNKYKCILK